MAEHDCLNNIDQLDSILDNASQIDSDLEKVVEVILKPFDTISVNGENVEPDENRNVNIEIPTTTSGFTNDGDGQSPFATEDFVKKNGGKIDSISVNGIEQPIDENKNVDIELPENIAETDKNNNFSTPQTINGTLTVNGDIVQNGESYETHAEKVYTKNDTIILREGAVGGLGNDEYAGFEAEKYDGENTGVLGFGADGVARVGDKGNEQPLLTREESEDLINGDVLVWNSKTNRAEGSSDYVKNTDYAGNNIAGVTISADDSALMNEKFGKNGEIPYVPSTRLSFAVKRGLINGKGNWTDEEKSSARTTLGVDEIVDTKLDKITDVTTYAKVYGKNADGSQTSYQVAETILWDSIPYRSATDGTFSVATPTKPLDAVNKKYVDDKFNGANKAVSFVNYSAMISSLNTLKNNSYSVGQNIMIVTLAVPDLWVSEIAEESVAYTYVSDDDFVNELTSNGSVQVGYFKLSALETQKVDLTEYVKNTDYASSTKAGLVTLSGVYGFGVHGNGIARIEPRSNNDIDSRGTYGALTPKNLDYAVKVGLTTNTETLTEEEKTAAQTWLGVPQIELTLKDNGAYKLTVTKG